MTDIVPVPNWGGVRQLETNEYATGGLNGNMNEQAKSLAGQNMYSRLYAGLPFDPVFTSQVGGFPIGGKVALEGGDIVLSTVASNVNNPNENMTGWVKENSASQIVDDSGKNQQEINNLYNRNGTPYFRTIFEFMPKSVVDDVFGAKSLDHSTYLQAAIDAVGNGGVIFIPLTSTAQINIGSTINIGTNNRSLKIIGTRGTASRDSTLTTFKWTGAINGGIMFDVLQSWGVTFEDCSFNGMDKASQILRIRSEDGVLPVKISHRHNFIRCGFENAYGRLITLGSGINEDLVQVKFDSCSFTYTSGNTTSASDAGIYIDAPQAYCLDFDNSFFNRGTYPVNMIHLKAGSVAMNDVTFEGGLGTNDIYIDPTLGKLSPQLTVTHAESQSSSFLKTSVGAGLFPTKCVLLQNVRHRADNGENNPVSIFWDIGHQGQLVHIGCSFQGIDIGTNATSVVEVAPVWGRIGATLHGIQGYTGNTSVVTGMNGFNITESSRTVKGGLRVGSNIFSVCPPDSNNNPTLFTGNKIEGDFWINNKPDQTKALPLLTRYGNSGSAQYAGDSPLYSNYTLLNVSNAGKYNYLLDFPIVPQVGAIYELRWNVLADNTNSIYEAGVAHIAFVRKGSSIFVRSKDVSLFQEATPILTTAAAIVQTSTGNELVSTSASQTALNGFTLRVKFLNALDNLASGASLKANIRRINY